MSLASVGQVLGWIIAAFALLMLLPAGAAAAGANADLAWTFAASAGLAGFVGGAMVAATQGNARVFGKREGYLFLCLLWPALAVFGAVPLYFAGLPGGPVGALFEAVSGLTTTGATVLVVPELSPPAVLLWRALLQGFGGFMTVVMAVTVLAALGIGALDLMPGALLRLEMAEHRRRVLQVTRRIAAVYLALLAICAVLLWFAGMNAFEAACHALAAVSTGGFSTRWSGVAAFDSTIVEAVLAVFMLAGACNLTLVYALAQGRWRAAHDHPEARYLVVFALLGVAIVVMVGVLRQPVDAVGSARFAAFAALSALTTTGFIGAGAEAEAVLAPGLIIALVLIGGAAGSTGGGLKLMRLAIMLKQATRELRRLTHAHAVHRVRLGRIVIDDQHIWSVWAFFFVFVLTLAGGAVGLALAGLAPTTAVAAAIAALSNAGPALSLIDPAAPAYVLLGDGAKLWLAALMLLGRLELLTFLILLNPAYWRN